jgi:hypothetical protein
VRARHLLRALSLALALPAGLAAPVSAETPADPGQARLLGAFLLGGHITSAAGIRGEHRGQSFNRTWTFQPGCDVGPCATVGLIRERAGGADRFALSEVSPGVYSASGAFYVPMRCAGRTYAQGESVPFSVTVRVTAAALFNGVDLATSITATYLSRYRINLTPCVRQSAHEAATYAGNLITPPAA